MSKKLGTILIYVSLLFVLCTANCFAETYTVVALKNCSPTYQGVPVKVGTRVSDPTKLKENWSSNSGSKYIKLQSVSDNSIQIITEPQKSKNVKKEGFLTSLWSSFTGQKKCSTRAPENELSGGLADYLSQTFYLLYSSGDSNSNHHFSIASNLDNNSKLLCSFVYQDKQYEFTVPISHNKFVFNTREFPIQLEEDRCILRLNVDYISPSGQQVPITNSMNIILIRE